MALVDLITGKIIGAKRGSVEYLHEQGHIEFNKSEKGIKLSYWQSTFYDFTITLIISAISFFYISKKVSIVFLLISWSFWLGYILLQQYEELWCWNYAKKNLKGGLDNARAKD